MKYFRRTVIIASIVLLGIYTYFEAYYFYLDYKCKNEKSKYSNGDCIFDEHHQSLFFVSNRYFNMKTSCSYQLKVLDVGSLDGDTNIVARRMTDIRDIPPMKISEKTSDIDFNDRFRKIVCESQKISN